MEEKRPIKKSNKAIRGNSSSLNKDAWNIELIEKARTTSSKRGLCCNENATSGLSRLANFKRLMESSRKDGEDIARPGGMSSSHFMRGKFMADETNTAQKPSLPDENAPEPTLVDAPSSDVAEKNEKGHPMIEQTAGNLRRRTYHSAIGTETVSRGLVGLIEALDTVEKAVNDEEDDGDTLPMKVSRNSFQGHEFCYSKETEKMDIEKHIKNDDEFNENKDERQFNKNNASKKSHYKKRSFDKPNYQRVNLRKKCFVRCGAASANHRRRLLKFRKRANRAHARRETAEDAEWGLDADANTVDKDGSPREATKRPTVVDYNPGSLTLTLPMTKIDVEKGNLLSKIARELEMSQEEKSLSQQLCCGMTVYQKLTPPLDYEGYEGWFHLASSWPRIIASTVEMHRQKEASTMASSTEDAESSSTAIGLVVLCDPVCPLPLPCTRKIAKIGSKAVDVSSYNKGGAVITGAMASDERQEVVSKARCSEISYVICRPEMLLSSDWFKRSGLPPVACVCLMFAERLLPGAWLANYFDIFPTGKNNASNVRPEGAGLIPRLYSLFGVEKPSDDFPLMVTSSFDPCILRQVLSNAFSPLLSLSWRPIKTENDVKIATFSCSQKYAACSKLLLHLAEKSDFSTVIIVCESLTSAMRLEQLLRQDGNIAVHLDTGIGKRSSVYGLELPSSSSSLSSSFSRHRPISLELSRMASQDDIIQSALQRNKGCSSEGSTVNVIVTTFEALHHVFLYMSRVGKCRQEKSCSVFVGIPPSFEYFNIPSHFMDNYNCVLVNSCPSVETNISQKSVFALSGNRFVIKQIAENFLVSKSDSSVKYKWKSVDLPAFSQHANCHPSLIMSVLSRLYEKGLIVDVAGSRQDICSVRLYGSDTDSVTLFEDNPIFVAARQSEVDEKEWFSYNQRQSYSKAKQRSVTFSLCEVANQTNLHPDQIRRQLYQMRPGANSLQPGKIPLRSPFVITFAPQWFFLYKIDTERCCQVDSLISSMITDISFSERAVRANKIAMASVLFDKTVSLTELKRSEVLAFLTKSFKNLNFSEDDISCNDSYLTPDFLKTSEMDVELAQKAIDDLIESWSSTPHGGGNKCLSPWGIARQLHNIVLPSGRQNVTRADWVPTVRVNSQDFQESIHLRVPFLKLVDLARKALIS